MITTEVVPRAAAKGRSSVMLLQHRGAEHLQLAADDLHGDVVAEGQREREEVPAATAGRGPAGRPAGTCPAASAPRSADASRCDPGAARSRHTPEGSCREPQVGQGEHDRREAVPGVAPKVLSSDTAGLTIVRQAYALTRYEAHSGTSTAATSSGRQRARRHPGHEERERAPR